jgi:hypothetical protein
MCNCELAPGGTSGRHNQGHGCVVPQVAPNPWQAARMLTGTGPQRRAWPFPLARLILLRRSRRCGGSGGVARHCVGTGECCASTGPCLLFLPRRCSHRGHKQLPRANRRCNSPWGRLTVGATTAPTTVRDDDAGAALPRAGGSAAASLARISRRGTSVDRPRATNSPYTSYMGNHIFLDGVKLDGMAL